METVEFLKWLTIVCGVLIVLIVIVYGIYRWRLEEVELARDKGVAMECDKECECGCDCLGEMKLEHRGELPDVYLDAKSDEIKKLVVDVHKSEYVRSQWSKIEGIPYRFDFYMKRGNKRYFRGENVKVVVTVKG